MAKKQKQMKADGNLDDLIKFEDLDEYAEVETPVGLIKLQALTAEELVDFLDLQQKDDKLFGLRLLVRCVVNRRNGERIGKPEHVEAMRKKSGRLLVRLANEAMRVNGLQVKDVDQK